MSNQPVIPHQFNTPLDYDAVQIRHYNGMREWAVRPRGQCGTCGFYPVAWTVVYVTARSEREAIQQAEREGRIIYKRAS